MKTAVAVLLGGNKLNRGIMDKFHRRGLMVVVIDWNSEPELRGDCHLQVDVKDAVGVLEALQTLGQIDLQIAYTSIDVAVPTSVAIHGRYDLMTPHGQHYQTPLTKTKMTAAWQRDGLLNRLSFLVPTGGERIVQQTARERQIIVKPNLSSSSRGITILPPGADHGRCANALQRAQRVSFDGQAVVEEFFAGREFTVEMLGDKDGNVSVYAISVKYHTQHAGSNKVANKLHYNSGVYSDETYRSIADYGRRCYQSLGLNCSFGHLEILMREDGLLSPVEIGARSSGFIASHLTDAVSGRDFLDDFMRVLQGEKVRDVLHQSSMSSMYYFYDLPPGKPCRVATNLLEHLPAGIQSSYADREAIQVGRTYQMIDNDTERYGHEILHGQRNLLTIETVESAEHQMLETMFGERN